jgi:hypothetical protein
MKKIMLSLVSVCAMSSLAFAGGGFVEEVKPVEVEIPETVISPKYAVGLKVGTLGLGLDISRSITQKLNVRLSLNGASYSDSGTESDVEYDYDLTLGTAGLLLDYFPMDNEFRISAGAYYNANEFELTGKPAVAGTYNINGTTYTTADLGALNGLVEFDEVAPYIGIGWGNSTKKAGWGFSVDVGVMYHGEPKVDLTATKGRGITDAEAAGGAAAVAATTLWNNIETDVASEETELLNELNDYKIYPVISFGVTYTF